MNASYRDNLIFINICGYMVTNGMIRLFFLDMTVSFPASFYTFDEKRIDVGEA